MGASVLPSCVMIQSTNNPTSRVFSKVSWPVKAIVFLGMGLWLGGCNKALAPSFTAVGVREVQNDGDRSVIEFLVKATNPNQEPIPLRQVHYTVELNGEQVFAGVRSPETTLHTYASHVFTLPAVLERSSFAGAGVVNYTLRGTVQYIPPGQLAEVLFDAKMKVPQATLKLSGTINTGTKEGDTGDDPVSTDDENNNENKKK